MKIILFVIICFASTLSFGQYLVLTNASSNTSCDGEAVFNTSGLWHFGFGYLAWKKIEGNDTILIQEGGFSLTNLCVGDYLLVAEDAVCEYPSVSKFRIKATSTVPCEDYSISCLVNEPELSSTYAKVVTEVYNGSPPYTFYFDNVLTPLDFPNIQSNCYYSQVFGQHSVKIVDSLGCVDSLTINTVEYDTCRIFLSMGYIYNDETITNACDGAFQLVPVYITDSLFIANNIHMVWDSGETGLSLTDLCPGYHFGTLSIENPLPNTCVARRHIIIEDALDSVFIYGNYNNQYSTLHSNWTDECSIDLTAIESAEITNIEFVAVDSVIVTWVLQDSSQLVATINAGYHIPNTSQNYNFVLQLYCLQKSFPIYANTVDQFFVGEMGIENSILENVIITPNPSENNLHIKTNLIFDSCDISDMSGHVLKTFVFSNDINIEDLSSGLFLLNLQKGEKTIRLKFVKK